MTNWETIEASSGSFIGWGSTAGQHVTGHVVDYAVDGGTDFAGGRCPMLAIELTEPAASFNKEGQRTDHEAGTLVNITAGQVKLKDVIRKTDPAPGDLVKVEMTGVARTTSGNTLKEFKVLIARGARKAAPAAAAPKAAPATDSFEAPF